RTLALGHLGWLMIVPLLFLQGVRHAWLLALVVLLGLGLSGANFVVSRRSHVSRPVSIALCCLDYFGVASVSALLGAWLFVPLLSLAVLSVHILHSRTRGANHTRMLAGAVAASLVPLAAEWLGALPQVAR